MLYKFLDIFYILFYTRKILKSFFCYMYKQEFKKEK